MDELTQLNAITTSFLDIAEARAQRHSPTTMSEWRERLQTYLVTMDYPVVPTSGTVSHEQAIEKAHSEYDKFRLIQDKTFITDFDRFISDSCDDSLLPFDLTPTK